MTFALVSFAQEQLRAVQGRVRVVTPAPRARGRGLSELCREALGRPVGGVDIARSAVEARRIVLVVSDATREEPRAELLAALREVLPWERVELVVACGTHEPCSPEVVPGPFRDRPIHVFDGSAESELVHLGRTPRGTRVRLLRALCEAQLVVATGRIRPHYFAGFSGGAKSIFPGCAHPTDALVNHALKADPSARLGRVEDNVCRLDMEAAALRLPGTAGMLNVLCDVDGGPVAAASGHLVQAHRALAREALECFRVAAPPSAVVVVADRWPVTRTLYQASKLLPPAGPLLEDGGTIILVADCADGIGPQPRVNEGIYRLGVRPQLPPNHRVVLVSTLAPEVVASSYAEPAPNLVAALDAALRRHPGARPLALWRAGEMVTVST